MQNGDLKRFYAITEYDGKDFVRLNKDGKVDKSVIPDDVGTEVVANPTGTATDDLTKIQVGETIYAIPNTTYNPFPNTWTTTGTIAQFCAAVNADSTAVAGMAYLGELRCSDLPASLVNVEAVVEVIDGTGTSGKVIHITITSGNVLPYRWEYTYWNNGTNVSGWKTWLSTEGGTVTGNITMGNNTALMGLYGDLAKQTIGTNTYGDIGLSTTIKTNNTNIKHNANGTTYDVLDSLNTSANPTLVGGETVLTSLKLNSTNYALGGGTQVTFVDWS